MAAKPTPSTEFMLALEPKSHADVLRVLTEFYCDRGGLGAAPKADLDALFVQLLVKYGNAYYKPFNAFRYAALLKIRESRVRSLHVAGSMKFSNLTESVAWRSLVEAIKDSTFTVKSMERGEVSFLLTDPALFRFFQQKVGESGGTASYSPSSETVTVGLKSLLSVLNDVLLLAENRYQPEDLGFIRDWTKETLTKVVESLGKEQIKTLKGKDKASGLATAWRAAKELKQLWAILSPLL